MAITIDKIIDPNTLNLAEALSEDELASLGKRLKTYLDSDLKSRQDWDKNIEEWMKIALQYKENKTFPWPKAANVKYPLVTTAAMQFSARAYPSLIIGKKPVKGRVVGKDDDKGSLGISASKIAEHMSYQLMEEMDEWEDDMDKLFMVLPIVGCAFKKTYFDSLLGRNVSELVLPRDFVVNYWARTIDKAARKCHIIELTKNDIYERKESGLFLDINLGDPQIVPIIPISNRPVSYTIPSPDIDQTTPYKIIECHCNWDLDQDGYHEPYIITFDYFSEKVLRIVPRFFEDSIVWSNKNAKAKIIRIRSEEYFTKYGFIPNPDGGFYDLGFGTLLGPINETINSSINQLLDQGTMYTTNGGFLGKGVRIKAGEYRFRPNEWKVINATVDDLRKAIYPLPIREPSNTLFQLLGTLVESGEKVASIAEIFVGKMPGQNTPATTTLETIKQGMAIFTAIYKRIYRSLDKELKKLFRLNGLYLDDVVDYPVELMKQDYENVKVSIIPTADPDVATDSEKLIKAQALLELVPLGTVNPQVATKRVLEAQRQEDIPELMNVQPQPNPEEMKMQMEMQLKQQDAQLKASVKQVELQLKMQESKFDTMMEMMKGMQEMKMEEMKHRQELGHEQQEHSMDMKKEQDKMNVEKEKMSMKIKHEKEKINMQSKKMKGAHNIKKD